MQAAHAHGEVRIVGGEWSLERVPAAPRRGAVAAHLVGLPDQAELATEILAVAGWLALDDLELEVDRATLEELESGGVVRTRRDEHRTVVELAHPVYGEVIRQRLPLLRTRTIYGRLADRLQARGLDGHDDVTRLAWWRVESGGQIDPALLVQAGRRAIVGRDHLLAARFASEAAAREPTTMPPGSPWRLPRWPPTERVSSRRSRPSGATPRWPTRSVGTWLVGSRSSGLQRVIWTARWRRSTTAVRG